MRLLCPYCGIDACEAEAMSCANCRVGIDDVVARSMSGTAGVPVPQESTGRGFLGRVRREQTELSPVQHWFTSTRRSVSLSELRKIVAAAAPIGVYNTEGGTVLASSRKLTECDACVGAWTFFVADRCEACGRGPDNMVCTASGNGDGVYPVWATDDDVIITSFLRGDDGLPELEDALNAMHDSAPLVLANLHSEGAWRIGEGFNIPVAVEPGDYEVTVWVGELPSAFDGLLHPVALSVMPAKMSAGVRRASDRGLAGVGLVPGQVAAAVWGDPAMSVLSHLQPMHEYVAMLSADFVGESNADLQVAWLVHQARRYPNSGIVPELAEYVQSQSAGDALARALSGMLIDQYPEAVSDLRIAATNGSAIARAILPLWELAVAKGRDPFVTWGMQNAFVANDRGVRVSPHDPELAMDYFCVAAVGGEANAASSFTWMSLIRGRYADGLALYEATRAECEAMQSRVREEVGSVSSAAQRRKLQQFEEMMRYQLANARSNAALLRLATSGETAKALSEWAANEGSGHVESLFYPALLLAQAGDVRAIARAKQMLTRSQLTALGRDFEEALTESEPGSWTHNWFQDALSAVQSNGDWKPAHPQPNARSGAVAVTSTIVGSVARFCTACGAEGSGTKFCTGCGEPMR